MSVYELEGLLKLKDQTRDATHSAGVGLDDVEERTKRAAASFEGFEVNNRNLYNALMQTDRGMTATQEEVDELAVKLGVADEKQLRAAQTARELVEAWRRGDITADDLSDSLKALNTGLSDTATKQDQLTSIVRTARTAMAAFGVVEVGRTITNLAALGAQSERTERSFENISGGAEAAEENLEAMRRATRGAVSDQDAMQLSSRLLQMRIADNSQELEQLTEMAVRLGGAMGKDATAAVEEFSLLIANKAKLRFDTFGLSVDGVEERIEKLRRSSRGLSEDEIFLQAVMEEGQAAMERLGPAIEDNQEIVDQAQASWQNLKTEAGQAFSVMASFGRPLKEVFDWLTKQLEVVNDLTENYGFFEARIRAVASILSLGAYNAQKNTLFGVDITPPEQQYAAYWQQVSQNSGSTQMGSQSTSVTMYNPQFVGVQSPTDMLEQLNRMAP